MQSRRLRRSASRSPTRQQGSGTQKFVKAIGSCAVSPPNWLAFHGFKEANQNAPFSVTRGRKPRLHVFRETENSPLFLGRKNLVRHASSLGFPAVQELAIAGPWFLAAW